LTDGTESSGDPYRGLGFSQRDLATAVHRGVQNYLFYLFSVAQVPSIAIESQGKDGVVMENTKPSKFVCTRTVLPFQVAYQDFALGPVRVHQGSAPTVFGTGHGQGSVVNGVECSVPPVDPERWMRFVQELLLGAPFGNSTSSSAGLLLNLAYVQRFAEAWRAFAEKFRMDEGSGGSAARKSGIVLQAEKEAEYYEKLVQQVTSGIRTVQEVEAGISRRETLARIEKSRGLLLFGVLRSVVMELKTMESSINGEEYIEMLRFSLRSMRTKW
jgi:hypothetical protein